MNEKFEAHIEVANKYNTQIQELEFLLTASNGKILNYISQIMMINILTLFSKVLNYRNMRKNMNLKK